MRESTQCFDGLFYVMYVLTLCVMLCLVTTEQRASEGALHTADGEAGRPEEEPCATR